MAVMVYSDAWGKLIYEKKKSQKSRETVPLIQAQFCDAVVAKSSIIYHIAFGRHCSLILVTEWLSQYKEDQSKLLLISLLYISYYTVFSYK